MIIEVFCSGPADTNSYLVACSQSKQAAVIDVPFGSADLIINKAKELSLSIQMILLTHSHWDHTAEVSLIKKKMPAPVYVHQKDAENLENPGSDALPLLFPVNGVLPDGFLADGQEIRVGELRMYVIHSPGHTPGGICLYLPNEEVLFSGDTLFQGTIGNLSFPTGQPDLMWESLKRLAALPENTRVYPGHGEPTTIGAEKWIAHAREHFN